VLKRAGIVVGLVAGGMLALTPLASADVAAPTQVSNACSSTQSGPVIVQTVNGLAGGIGIVAPVTTQLSALNCVGVNLSNLVNVNSGNTTTTTNRTRIVNSFNRFFRFG
jgi:hypothetical protein